MKRLMVVATLALSGCVAGQEDAPVQFTSALALAGVPGADCTVDTSKFISRGRLNLAEEGSGNYTLAMQVRSTVPIGRVVSVGGSNVTQGGEPVRLSEFIYTYDAPAALGLPKEETVATYAVLKAGTQEGYVFVNAFGPKALDKLVNSGQVSDTPVGVISTIKARGRLGSSSNVESNEFSFPISVFRTSCSSTTKSVSICNPGQDFTCVKTTP